MQHIEVHLYENEEYDEYDYESYWASNRLTLVGEMEFEFQDMYFIHLSFFDLDRSFRFLYSSNLISIISRFLREI